MKRSRCFALLLCLSAAFGLSADAETFRNPVRIPTDSDPVGLSVADLNNDGRPDILWGAYGTSTGPAVLHAFLARASGGFVAGPSTIMPTNVGSVCETGDENGDGILDLVCPSGYQYTASIYTFPGKGDGSFGTPVISAVPSLPSNGAYVSFVLHAMADLNGDGIADLVLTEAHTGSGFVMLGDGHGNFTKPSAIFGYGSPQFMDVNGDGKIDILFSGGYVWLGKGDGTFSQPPGNLPSFASYTFHDMDGDGNPDAIGGLLGQSNGGTQLEILHGNGDGTFNPTPITVVSYGDQSSGPGTFHVPFAVVDLNNDGVPDILGGADDGFTVILGRGALTFETPTHYATGYLPMNLGIIGEFASVVADLNNDGLPDIVSIGPNGIYITYARKDGTLDTASAYEVAQVIGYETLADFNEDGIADIAVSGDKSIELNLGTGKGTFHPPIALPSGNADFSTPLSASNAHIVHGDFNGDHHQDILAIGSSAIYQYDSYVLFGDGKGSFTTPQLVPTSQTIYPMWDSRISADLNRDGRDDLFSNDYSNLYAWLSNGDGTFNIITTATNVDSSQSGSTSPAVLADFNRDGKLDALWTAGSEVEFSRGHGDGTFDASVLSIPVPTALSSSSRAVRVNAGDFDGDGNQDFALLISLVSPTYASAVYVYYGKGNGTFTAPVLAGKFDRSYTEVSSADLNNEGLADLILITKEPQYGGEAIGIVDSLPNRTFAAEVNYYAGTGLADISVADLNHDGFHDLLFSNGPLASSVTVLMNQGNPPVTGTVTVSPEPSQYKEPVTVEASFVPSSFTPVTGTVTFTLDSGTIGTSTISGNKASLAISTPILPGTHTVAATWPGNSIYSAVTLTATHVVEKVPSSVTLSSSLNPAPLGSSVTFTASVQSTLPAVAGVDTVTFLDGQTQIGVAAVGTDGQTSTFTTSSLAFGTHSITAVYSGNSEVQGSTSNALSQSIPYFVGDFSIQATPPAATITAGQSAAYQVTIATSGGFSAPMAFSCAGLPALTTCTFTPTTLPTGQGQVALKIQTTKTGTSAMNLRPHFEEGAAILAGILLCMLPTGLWRNRFTKIVTLAVVGLAVLSTASCGGGGAGGGGGSGGSGGGSSTPAGSYTVTITAVTTEPSQNISHSTTVTLTVQ